MWLCENNEVFQGNYINLVDIIIAIFKDPVRGTIISQLSHGVPYWINCHLGEWLQNDNLVGNLRMMYFDMILSTFFGKIAGLGQVKKEIH